MSASFYIRIIMILLTATPLFPCRMLGVIALPGESLSDTYTNGYWHPYLMGELEAFRLQGGSGGWPYNNRDGWAMTSYFFSQELLEFRTIRSDEEAFSDNNYYEETATLLNESQVPLLIGHLRQTSSGATNIENPHPFIYTTVNGVNFSFAHNGDVGKQEVRELIGDDWLTLHPPQTYGAGAWNGSGWENVVDSELFFFWIMKNIEETESVLEGIQQALIVLEDQQPFQLKNFLLSDGTDLYAYRRSSMNDIHYFDASQSEGLPPYLSNSNHRVIMSTPPTGGSAAELPWIELPDRNLLIFRGDGSTEIHADFLTTQIVKDDIKPGHASVRQAYPNPFNNSTIIPLQAYIAGSYTIDVFTIQGQLVFSETQWVNDGSEYDFLWSGQAQNGTELFSGSYFYQFRWGTKPIASGKLLLLK